MNLLLLLAVAGGAAAFSLSSVAPKEITVKLGEPWSAMCKTSSWYEVSNTGLQIQIYLVPCRPP